MSSPYLQPAVLTQQNINLQYPAAPPHPHLLCLHRYNDKKHQIFTVT